MSEQKGTNKMTIGRKRPAALSLSSASTKIEEILSATATLATIVLQAFENVEYVGVVAAAVLKVIEIWEEINSNKARCEEIIGTICKHCQKLLRPLRLVAQSKQNGTPNLEDLQSDLEEYKNFLVKLWVDLHKFTSTSKWGRFVKRKEMAEDLERIDRDLTRFLQAFQVTRLTSIEVRVNQVLGLLAKCSGSMAPQPLLSPPLPPPPLHIVGRDGDILLLTSELCNAGSPRIALLGLGGIGKTTLATALMSDHSVQAMYPTRYFVSFEAATTADLFLKRIASTLAIPDSLHDEQLLSRIVHALSSHEGRVLLMLDNLETAWEQAAQRAPVNEALNYLSGIGPSIALMITMRGSQSPASSSILWHSHHLSALQASDSAIVYEKITNVDADEWASRLLQELDGIPLAITLFAHLVSEGENPKLLWERWTSKGVSVLENGGEDRLSRLDRSIALSVFSPQVDDAGRQTLYLLSLLPDGLLNNSTWLKLFEACLPDGTDLHSSVRTLRRVSLVHLGQKDDRLRILSPVRQYCRLILQHHECLTKCPDVQDSISNLVSVFVSLIIDRQDFGNAEHRDMVRKELPNIRALLLHRPESQDLKPQAIVVEGARCYTEWIMCGGVYDPEVLEAAMGLTDDEFQKGICHLTMGAMCTWFGHLKEADESLTQACKCFETLDDRMNWAHAHRWIGSLRMRQQRPVDALSSYRRSLSLYQEAEQGKSHPQHRGSSSMGVLPIEHGKMTCEDALYQRLCEVYEEVDNGQGNANAYYSKRNLYIRSSRQLDRPEQAFERALVIHEEAAAIQCRANTLWSFGHVCLQDKQFTEAEAAFLSELEIHCGRNERYRQANMHWTLGNLKFRLQAWPEAEKYYEDARALYEELKDRLRHTSTSYSLGRVFLEQGRLEEADALFQKTLVVYEDTRNLYGRGRTLYWMGVLRGQKQHRWEEAELCFSKALEDHRQMGTICAVWRKWDLEGLLEACTEMGLVDKRQTYEDELRKNA